jgi:G3E family GTPase
MTQTEDRLRLSILTGFLGSGKTTLLNRLLRHRDMGATAVIVNEFGEIGIDDALVIGASDQILLMESGCLCCTLRGNLIDTLADLMLKRQQGSVPPFSRVVIETTGLADPAPILQALMTDLMMLNHFRMGHVVTVVDAVHGCRTMDERPEAVMQAAIADCLLVSKTDIAPAGKLEQLLDRLHRLNPVTPVIEVQFGAIEPARLFGSIRSDPISTSAEVAAWLTTTHSHNHTEGRDAAHQDRLSRDDRIRSYSLTAATPLEWNTVADWLDELALAYGNHLLRIKGLLNISGQDEPVLIQGVREMFHPPVALPAWPDADRRSRLVIIVQDLDLDTLLADAPASLSGTA